MKMYRKLSKVSVIISMTVLLAGCVINSKFTYSIHDPLYVKNYLTSSSTFYFSVTDLREDKDLIGFQDNIYGQRVNIVKTTGEDIPNSICTKFKTELLNNGFGFSDDQNKCDYRLILSITSFLGETFSSYFSFHTKAECCMRITLKSGKDNSELYKTEVCGHGEKKTSMILDRNDINLALIDATDEVLNKILNETTLITYISGNIK